MYVFIMFKLLFVVPKYCTTWITVKPVLSEQSDTVSNETVVLRQWASKTLQCS